MLWVTHVPLRRTHPHTRARKQTQVASAKEELRPALARLGWTENEVKWAQARADGDLIEGIRLLLKDETSSTSHSQGITVHTTS